MFAIIFLGLLIICMIFLLLILIKFLNNILSKKINEKNLSILQVIEKKQYNSSIFYAVKIVNNKSIYFNEINMWLSRYFNIFYYHFQRWINEYNYVISNHKYFFNKYFFTVIFYLLFFNKKFKKIANEIDKLNDEIKQKIKIKNIEDEYKINLVTKYQEIKIYFNQLHILYSEYFENKNSYNLISQLDENINLVDEKIDNGEFCLSAKILLNIFELLIKLFNITNLYPQILKTIDTQIIEKIQNLETLTLFQSYSSKSNDFKNEFINFKNNSFKNVDVIKEILINLDYDNAILKLNNLLIDIENHAREYTIIDEINLKYISSKSLVFLNINILFENLKNLLNNSPLYLGNFNKLPDSELLMVKKIQKEFDLWNDEISKVISHNDTAFRLKDFAIALFKTNSLISNSLKCFEYVKNLREIYIKYKKSINDIYNKIFKFKNTLNNLMQLLKKYKVIDLREHFIFEIQKLFKEIDEIKLNRLYPSDKKRINNINNELNKLEKNIFCVKKDIKDIILYDKLTEELIVYNNKFLLYNPEVHETLRESKKAYDANDIDLSFRISLSILNSIKRI